MLWLALLLPASGSVLRYSGRKGDARNAAERTHLPSWLWAGAWQPGAAVGLVAGAKLLP